MKGTSVKSSRAPRVMCGLILLSMAPLLFGAQEGTVDELDNVFIVQSSGQNNPKDFPNHDGVHYNTKGLLNIDKALTGKGE